MTIAKAVAAAVVALGTSLVIALENGDISFAEGITGVLAVLGSGGVVWYALNGPGAQYVKAVIGSMSAALTTLLVALEDNIITEQEWVTALVAAVVGLGIVAAVPNKPVA